MDNVAPIVPILGLRSFSDAYEFCAEKSRNKQITKNKAHRIVMNFWQVFLAA
jgi:hypothetical protein